MKKQIAKTFHPFTIITILIYIILLAFMEIKEAVVYLLIGSGGFVVGIFLAKVLSRYDDWRDEILNN